MRIDQLINTLKDISYRQGDIEVDVYIESSVNVDPGEFPIIDVHIQANKASLIILA